MPDVEVKRINELPAASAAQNDDLIPVMQDGVTKYATVAQVVANSEATDIAGLPPATTVSAADSVVVVQGGTAKKATGADFFFSAQTTAHGRQLAGSASADATLTTLGVTLFAKGLLNDADATEARASLGLTPGVDVQQFDADLTALAGLGSSADKLPYFTGPAAATVTTLTPFARTLLDDATASAARTTLGIVAGSAAIPVFDVKTGYNAVGDGSADDTTPIVNAIAACAAVKGGIVYFPPGTYKITSTISITVGNVFLMGGGADNGHDTGSQGAQASSILKWGGANAGTMLKFTSPASGGQKQRGGGVQGIYIDSNYNTNGAAIGIHVNSWNAALFQDILFREFSTACMFFNCLADGSLGEAEDVQECLMRNITARQHSSGGSLFKLDGSTNAHANTSCNLFINCDVVGLSGDAARGLFADMWDCDNNTFIRCRSIGLSSTPGIVTHGANDGGTARGNIFMSYLASNTTILCKGTDEGFSQSSRHNFFYSLDNESITPVRTGGASAHWVTSTGNAFFKNVTLEQLKLPNAADADTTALDWYEEGTWTPVLEGDAVAGTQTYSNQDAKYTRIGNRVIFNGRIILTAFDGATTGILRVSGLPFVHGSGSPNNTGVSIAHWKFDLAAGFTDVSGYIPSSSSFFWVARSGDNVTPNKINATEALADTQFHFSGSYPC